jgi:hypothetical protein
MTASELIRHLGSRGIRLEASAGRLRVDAPAGVLTDPDRAALIRCKGELLALLCQAGTPAAQVSVPCPQCGRPADEKGCCWKCCNRACSGCRGPTGSAFIAMCRPCEVAFLRKQELLEDGTGAG